MAETSYWQVRVSRYFTLYFIPLFPTSTLGEYITCDGCHSDLPIEVLSLSREQIQQAMQPWACSACGNRNPRSEANCLACGASRGEASAAPPPLPPPVPRFPS